MKNSLISQFCFIAGCLCFWVLPSEAQTTRISRILDQAGNPIAGVRIKAVRDCAQTGGPSMPQSKETITDTQGQFEWPLPENPPGVGSNCTFTENYTWTLSKTGFTWIEDVYRAKFSPAPPGFPFNGPFDARLPVIYGTNLPRWATVSAASYDKAALSAESVAAAFGASLSDKTESAGLPLPTMLGNRLIVVRDTNGQVSNARFFFVSPGQVNFILPSGLAEGMAAINLVDQNGAVLRSGGIRINCTAPGIFTSNANGSGVPAALLVRVKANGELIYEPVARYDDTLKRYVPLPLELGKVGDFEILVLFGTGWRQVTSLSDVVVKFGVNDPVLGTVEYAGLQPTLVGLDQINVRLPRILIGRGELVVDLAVRGQAANSVVLNFK